ncbi:helix-turn-helix domain-containing protein [Leisingera methylohalidivorans]|uniref:XRE family transcriptional regulator n=1 Tax=Leisingera methylohalidivorans DSM 14336 TaxID=999552 RepID=V9VVV1_9RHOB|nr:helix-turn-helix transcriptional regulator [Leisingera methylohalidivorans]AHD02093.1 XRE family transcriptional regulator [Leisingera methylohalidivorans DSM 14336]
MTDQKHPELIRLGQSIRSIRKDKGLSLTQLAQLTGASVSALSTIETGTRDARASTLYRIAKALRVPAAELFEASPADAPHTGTASGYDLGDLE